MDSELLPDFCRSDRQKRGKGKRSKGRAQSEGNAKYMLVMRNLNKKQYKREDFLPCPALLCSALPYPVLDSLSLLVLPLPCPLLHALPCFGLPAACHNPLSSCLLISSPDGCWKH